MRTLSVVLLTAVPFGLAGQEISPGSCAVADSVLGVAGKRETFKGKYDEIDGRTTYFLIGALSSPLFGGSMDLIYAASHEGQSLARPVTFSLIASYEVVAGGQDNIFRQTDLTEQSKLKEMETVPVLIDDSVRFSLQVDRASRKYNSQALQILIGRTMKETAIYPLSEEQVQRLATATQIQLRVGGRKFTFDKNKMRKLREFYRMLLCSAH